MMLTMILTMSSSNATIEQSVAIVAPHNNVACQSEENTNTITNDHECIIENEESLTTDATQPVDFDDDMKENGVPFEDHIENTGSHENTNETQENTETEPSIDFEFQPETEADGEHPTEPVQPEVNHSANQSSDNKPENVEQESDKDISNDHNKPVDSLNQEDSNQKCDKPHDDQSPAVENKPSGSSNNHADENLNNDIRDIEQKENKPTCPPTPSEPVIKKPCDVHDLKLTRTASTVEYELYVYVTDYYECSVCDYTTSDIHIAKQSLSKAQIDNIEKDLINCVNKLRQQNGLDPLSVHSAWDEWANIRAQEQAIKFGHQRPNGESWVYAVGDTYTVGENVAVGQSSGRNFYEAFFNSPSHYDNMMASDALHIAVSILVDDDGNTYCAMILIGSF